MEATIDYTTEAGVLKPLEVLPQIKIRQPAKDSSLGSLLLSGISSTATILYWRWEKLLEEDQTQGQPDLTLPQRLINPLYGREGLNLWLQDKSSGAPAIEEVWRITERLPSLTDLLLEERENE